MLILDDVMSELDLARRRKLLAELDGVQAILTCTHTEKVLFGREVRKIRISGGKICRPRPPQKKGKLKRSPAGGLSSRTQTIAARALLRLWKSLPPRRGLFLRPCPPSA